MPNRVPAVLLFGAVLLAALLVWLTWGGDPDSELRPDDALGRATNVADVSQGDLAANATAVTVDGAGDDERQDATVTGPKTAVRGIVLDANTAQPLGGIEIIAIKDQPSLEPLIARFRGLFQDGMFVETRAPRRELGRTISNPDGTFEITGLPAGRVFLDGRSDGWFVRTPGTARLAVGEIRDGIELRASPAGRVRGVVLGPDGAPAAGAAVSLRPGVNAFFGQLTQRQYRWLETVTDEDGRFDLPGVPAGAGYTATAAAPRMALEEQHGVDVRAGEVTHLTLQSHLGATIMGQVVDGDDVPVAGAAVALVYLDISRMLLSADGRSEPLQTDEDGRFRIDNVAAGRVAFVAMAEGSAPSNIAELAVVDGGIYPDIVLQTSEGTTVRGRVVDDQKQPVADAAVEVRPFERPDDPQFIKMMLKVRKLATTTATDGTFEVKGMTGQAMLIQASKPGYTTAIKRGVELDEEDIVVEVQRGATIRGVVTNGGEPVKRFRVDTRTRDIPEDEDAKQEGAGENGDKAVAEASQSGRSRNRDRGRRRGFRFGPPGRMRRGTRQLPEGQTMGNRGMDGNWREIQSEDGTFELTGIPPGRIRVRVRADGFINAEEQTIDLQPAQTSEVLAFEIAQGQPVSGTVVDGASGRPVSDAQVTAYKQREEGERRRGFPFRGNIDAEDFDFLGLSSARSQRSAMSDSRGAFQVTALAPGKYRFTARHPDLAKSSTKDVEVVEGQPTPNIEIVLDSGGGIEGTVTGIGMRPLADALMVAFSLQAGTMRSSTTDKAGFYRIDGLPPGQYIVFKSRMDERADNIGLELMSNMRLKTVTVRKGKFSRLDVHDEGEDGVRVFGVVRENGVPVPRALVTLLGSDREGLLGMGVRANAAGMDGRYELAGIKPGDYVMQVSRFQGEPIQTTFELEVPDELTEFRFDVELPTSSIKGRVIDTRGNPVSGMRVTLGTDEGALAGADGLVGVIAQNGLSQDRTDDNGEFELRSVASGKYRVTAGRRGGGPGGRRRSRSNDDENAVVHGEASLGGVQVDGVTNVEALIITVPIAGKITGIVVDGSGQPVPSAEIAYKNTSEKQRRRRGNPMLDLFGASRAITTDSEGKFEITALNPGEYEVRAEKGDAVEAARKSDIRVDEDMTVDVTLRLVRGATLRVRATNASQDQIPLANISLLDGKNKPVISRVSTLSVLRRLMKSRDEVKDSGWYEFGSVPPDTYTVIIAEAGKPEVRITRTIMDGETVEWDIDVQAELEAQGRAKK
ncbi:MAG: carboxypeptidase-like regulatory domain-containing protein [bacterium]|nr:carboxypeptidase-like regulatory domain-containing protein [bacterium]